ncbi:MAG TPA: hypothetical protein VMW48_01995 [Vicinamibacterales bacterium]|nr:hypothetical protein [Vicinamibacterales bacterium]
MITVITYLWGTKHYQPGHVQQLARSVARWLSVPHRFVCVTSDAVPGVETMPNPVPGLTGRCYRRLWLFSKHAARRFGTEGILHLDLDLVICGPLGGFISAEDFRIYRAGSVAARGYSLNPSVCWLRPGTQADIWARYWKAPTKVAAAANAAGFWGSDQAVISYFRQAVDVPTFGEADGLCSYRTIRHLGLTAPPEGTRIVSFHGKRSPYEREIQRAHPWIVEAWKEAA